MVHVDLGPAAREQSRAHFLAIIFLAIGFLDSFRFLDGKKSMRLYFSIADRHFSLVGPVNKDVKNIALQENVSDSSLYLKKWGTLQTLKQI